MNIGIQMSRDCCSVDLAGFPAIEEDQVRLHAMGVKDASRQTQDRLKLGGLERFLRTVSPAPRSNRTLSGTTMAARPVVLSI